MKDKIPIEKVYLAYHYEATFLQALRRSAEEHGYKGLWGLLCFWTVKTIDYFLQMAAYFAPYTGIRVWLHRLRSRFRRAVWLNPMPADWWGGWTTRIIGRLLPMYSLTIAGLERAVDTLVRGRPQPVPELDEDLLRVI